MSARVGAQKGGPRLRREMTDVEDRVEVLNRYRNGIGRIRDLTNEAAVLAHGVGKPEPHSRRTLVENFLEDALVDGNRTGFGRLIDSSVSQDYLHCSDHRRST